MKTKVTKIVHWDMAHKLTSSYAKECQRVHGHTYRLEVTFEGSLNADGMIIDFKKIKEMLQEVVGEFDHTYIDERVCGYNPTAENMCIYIFRKLSNLSPQLYKVRLWETKDAYAEVSY